MAQKKVIADFQQLLDMNGVACLVNSDGFDILDFKYLQDGGVFELGPQQKPTHLQKLDDAVDYILRIKEESETLVMSSPQTLRYVKAIERIGVRRDCPVWTDKPVTCREPPTYL
jgi:hypothetical protein